MPTIPVIDLAGPQRDVVDAIVDACRRLGFLIVVGHGLDPAVEDAAWDNARAFFDLPLEEKMRSAMPSPGYPYGYAPFGAERLSASLGAVAAPDLKQTISIGPVDPQRTSSGEALENWARLPTIWPANPAGLRPAWEAFYRAMADLAARLMRLFAIGLDLAADHFDPLIDEHVSALRFLDYPRQVALPEPGQLRAGPHTDYGTLTILRQEQRPGGLEIADRDGSWLPVDHVAGSYVVNLGDAMARWTNDRWRSTLHRVVNPPTNADGESRRQSIAFFHNANWDAEIECIASCLEPGEAPRYEPVRAGAHLMAKFQRTGSTPT